MKNQFKLLTISIWILFLVSCSNGMEQKGNSTSPIDSTAKVDESNSVKDDGLIAVTETKKDIINIVELLQGKWQHIKIII